MLISPWYSEAFTHRGLVRTENQDSYLSDDKNQLWLVADGMGGGKGGALASQMLRQAFEDICLEEGLAARVNQLEQLVLSVNLEIYRYARETFAGEYMGTTLVLLNRWQDLGILIWAGDSRCYGLDAGQLQCLSWDHTQATELVKLGQVSEQEIQKLPKSHAITRAVGLQPDLCLEFQVVNMASWRLLLLCSDGIYGEVSQALMFNCFTGDNSIADKMNLLREKVLQAGAHDNLTVICLYPGQQAPPPGVSSELVQCNRRLEQLQLDYYLGETSRENLRGQREQVLMSVAGSRPEPPTLEINSAQVKALYRGEEKKRRQRDPVYVVFITVIISILLVLSMTFFAVMALG